MFTDQRKDKKAVLYLKRKLAVLEWIKDYFTQNGEMVDTRCNDLIELIEDGVVLCKLFNFFFPNRIEKIIYPKSMGSSKYFLRIENINSFITQCQRIKLPIIFQTLDLFECKNPVRVVNCIHSLIELFDPTNNLKDRIINKKSNKFTIEDIARASLELQIEKEASGKSMSMILYDTINPSLNETMLDDPIHSSIDNTTTSILNNTPQQQQQQQQQQQPPSTIKKFLVPPQTPSPSSIVLNTPIVQQQQQVSSPTTNNNSSNFGTVQYQMTNSNTYESNNLSVLNTSHLRTTIIKTPLSRINNNFSSVYGSGGGGSEVNTSYNNNNNNNYQNTPQIHHTPGFPLSSIYQNQQQSQQLQQSQFQQPQFQQQPEMATSSMMKTASISTVPVKLSPSPIQLDSRFLTNSTYSNRFTNNTLLNESNINSNNTINRSTINNNNTHQQQQYQYTPYRPSIINNNVKGFESNLKISDLNSKTKQSQSQSQIQEQEQEIQEKRKIQIQQRKQKQELEQQQQQQQQKLLQQQKQQHQLQQQQKQQSLQNIISTTSTNNRINRQGSTWCRDILLFIILIVSIFIWLFLYLDNNLKLNSN